MSLKDNNYNKKKVTIKDVARECNVSEATVSRVMSNSSLISEKTKKKVRKVIKKLEYYPNSSAVSLTKSSSKIIAVVAENQLKNPLQNDFFTEILAHIVKFAQEKGYYILYIHSESEEKTNIEVKKMINTNRVDGVLFLSLYQDDTIVDYLDEINFPYVTIGKTKDEKKGLWVDTDNFFATYEVTKRLIDSGLKKIGFISGPKNLMVSNHRLEGFKRALKENNLSVNKKQIIFTNFDIFDAEKAAKTLLEYGDLEGIVTTDDILAIGALNYLEKINKSLKVTGFNNSKLRKYLKMKFTTIDINYDELAKKSIFLLVDKIENNKSKTNGITVKSIIIEGE